MDVTDQREVSLTQDGRPARAGGGKRTMVVVGAVIVVLLLGGGIAAVVVSQSGKGGDDPAPAPAPAPPPPPAPPFWFFCADVDKCHHPGTDDGSDLQASGDDEFAFQTWVHDPKSLIDKVGDFSSVPTIDQAAYDTWAKVWDAQSTGKNGVKVKLSDIADFAKQLLSENPFNTANGSVPFLDFEDTWVPEKGDIAAKVVAISQRQLAFIIVNTLMNNTLSGGENGFHRILAFCPSHYPYRYDFVHSILAILAILSQELAGGEHMQGTMLVGAVPGRRNGKVTSAWKDKLTKKNLIDPNVCNKVGDKASGCKIDDFMSGGTSGFQVLTDIAGGDVGGGSQLCNIANSQDESLVQFYTEVLAYAFFVQGRAPYHMLPVPFVLLGSRRYVNNIQGNREDTCGSVTGLNGDIGMDTVKVPLVAGDKSFDVEVYGSSFMAQASECAAATCGKSCSLTDMKNNQCDCSRHSIDKDIERWYQSYEKTMYNPAIHDAFKGAIKSIGTGPWGSGVWYGDSQMYFLMMWMANSLLDDVGFDYYIYSRFCENPGNQCFVLGKDGCSECIDASKTGGLGKDRCEGMSYQDVVKFFSGKSVNDLYTAAQSLDGGDPSKEKNLQAFDVLMNVTHAPTPAPGGYPFTV